MGLFLWYRGDINKFFTY